MTRNLILEELYAAREKLLADAGGDAHKYLDGVRERERASGRLPSPEDMKNIRRAREFKTAGQEVEQHS